MLFGCDVPHNDLLQLRGHLTEQPMIIFGHERREHMLAKDEVRLCVHEVLRSPRRLPRVVHARIQLHGRVVWNVFVESFCHLLYHNLAPGLI